MRRRKLAVLALVPALLSGCGVLGLSSAPGDGGNATPSPSSTGWIVVAHGSTAPTPSPSGAARPTPRPTSGFLPLRPAAVTATHNPTCSPRSFNFSRIAAADVVPSTTSAVVSWYNAGGANLVQFRLTAISQDLRSGKQRDVGFVTVAPKTPCGQMSAVITRLDRRTGYVFSVDAVVYRKSGDGTRATTVSRSGVVHTR